MHSIQLGGIDYAILILYFAFVVGIGWALKRFMKSSEDFFLSGRSIPAWVAGLAFLSANLGAQEVIGMGASGAKYGIMTSHFYWVGAIPAMVFVGIFMMPFYYGSRARSVPEYLKLRFDEKTRGFNAISFAVMTVFSSGISMYALAKLLNLLFGWDFDVSIVISAAIVLIYILLGGLTSAIYNEVLQFFLIVLGFIPLVFLGLKDAGGWSGMQAKLSAVATGRGFAPGAWGESWRNMNSASANPMGVEWFGMVMGLGFVLSFGYWCTDFLVVQRAMAARSMSAARRTPLIASIPKMLFPFLVIVPGMIAITVRWPAELMPRADPTGISRFLPASSKPEVTGRAPPPSPAQDSDSRLTQGPSVDELLMLAQQEGHGLVPPKIDEKTKMVKLTKEGKMEMDYDLAVPMMLVRYLPTGLLGLGLCALMASFMSGMAGNVTAFNTVWTYDIYQSYICPRKSDEHYLWMGRAATVFGIGISVACAYAATRFNNIMDMLQLVFAFVNAPLFATFMLGMFWRRATGHGSFFGLLLGTAAAALHHGLTLSKGAEVGIKGGWLGPLVHIYPSEMAQNFWTAIWAWTACFVMTILISLATKRRKTDDELRGLVYSLTPRIKEHGVPWYKQPATLGVVVLGLAVTLNIIFW
jgi:SSS family solute:Na+ symporter